MSTTQISKAINMFREMGHDNHGIVSKFELEGSRSLNLINHPKATV